MRCTKATAGLGAFFMTAASALADVRVNTYTTGGQIQPRAAMDASGAAVVVWSGPQSGQPFTHVLGRRYGADGAPMGPEFLVSSSTWGGAYASVASQPGGGFVVAWWNPDGVHARVFDASGAPLAPEALVNTPGGFQKWPTVATDALGNFVVAWHVLQSGVANYDLLVRRFDATGTPLDVPVRVNTYTTGAQRVPALAVAPGGDFIVVWADRYHDGDLAGIVGQRFSATGAPLGGEFVINAYTTGYQGSPSVAADADGNFVVAWSGPDGDGSGIFARRHDSAGVPLEPEFLVNQYTIASQAAPAIATDTTGDFLVVWSSPQESGGDVFARRYGASGLPLGSEFRVNGHVDLSQSNAAAAAGADGQFLVAWVSRDQDGSGSGIYADQLVGDPLFGDGFESGELSAWTSASTDGGDLSVSATAALAGTTQGLEGTVDDTAGLYVEDDSPAGESRYRARFYVDTNGFDPGESAGRYRTRVFVAFSESPSRRVLALALRRRDGQYRIQARVRLDDDRQALTPFHPVSDGPHWVEFDWRRATEPGALDGWFRLWIDGVAISTLTHVNNGAAAIDFVRLGALSAKAGAVGTLYWDEFESRRETPIGGLP